jgi:hypothetical protein
MVAAGDGKKYVSRHFQNRFCKRKCSLSSRSIPRGHRKPRVLTLVASKMPPLRSFFRCRLSKAGTCRDRTHRFLPCCPVLEAIHAYSHPLPPQPGPRSVAPANFRGDARPNHPSPPAPAELITTDVSPARRDPSRLAASLTARPARRARRCRRPPPGHSPPLPPRPPPRRSARCLPPQ